VKETLKRTTKDYSEDLNGDVVGVVKVVRVQHPHAEAGHVNEESHVLSHIGAQQRKNQARRQDLLLVHLKSEHKEAHRHAEEAVQELLVAWGLPEEEAGRCTGEKRRRHGHDEGGLSAQHGIRLERRAVLEHAPERAHLVLKDPPTDWEDAIPDLLGRLEVKRVVIFEKPWLPEESVQTNEDKDEDEDSRDSLVNIGGKVGCFVDGDESSKRVNDERQREVKSCLLEVDRKDHEDRR